ncbi:uncharacterized protein (TIGR02271 family) [Kineococcus radiotolerans]|uniref:Uncharacterized protein (TIGR02271 family) n=1 Tax=Kineococcus radiotolerans TaxID=131568 RepID=A0A7W4XVP9_KINRA|nr:PRC and DUF2382 domain-containing protein [Kineococcus radiotolerans]MBB2899404.1 uncharacterized protein (TIGR02271 family) [Kineococcus radiotolerans]
MARDFTPESLVGATVTGTDGDRIGKVDEVFLDNRSGQPEWVSVKTGLFGSNVSLLPLAQASLAGDTVTVPFDKATVKDAPHHDPGRELSAADEDDLYRYYGVSGTSSETSTGTRVDLADDSATTGTTTTGTTTTTTTTGTPTGTTSATTGGGAGHDTSGPDTDDAMTRSKEELHVGTASRIAGRARLRKHITSETVSREVPVTHEEVTLTREPITEANRDAALSGGDLTEEEHEVVLTEEHAVAAKETVPVERVQVGKKVVEGTETVHAQVHEEHIDLDSDAPAADLGDQRR